MKVLVAELALENRLLKKLSSWMGETRNKIPSVREAGEHPAG